MAKKDKNNISNEKDTKQLKEPINAEIVEDELLPYNPLLENHTMVITPEDESEKKIELINETETLIELNEQKLKAEQRKARLEIELQKIKASKKLTEAIDNLIDIGISDNVLKRVINSIDTPYDLKMFSDALRNFTETRDKNMESTVRDEFGRRKKTKIMAAFRTQTGEEMMISAEMPDND